MAGRSSLHGGSGIATDCVVEAGLNVILTSSM